MIDFSPAKERWIKHFKPNQLRGLPLNPNISDAIRYKRQLDRLINKMTQEVEKQIKSLFKGEAAQEYFAKDESLSSQARILTNALTRKFNDIFATFAKPLAEQIVNESNKSSSSSLNASLKELSGGLALKTTGLSDELVEILNASVVENVALIKSISEQYLDGVQQAVMRSITSGQGMADLLPYLESHKEITKRRAQIIAYDQTRKAFNNINRSRMQKLGIKEFEWLHSGGSSHPRKLHVELSGKIFSFDNPPYIGTMYGEKVYGYPGQLPNCFVGSTQVSLANGCSNLWRYKYTGNIVNIVVQGNITISTTPNHPILTLRGWLPAHEIQEGDYLVSSQADNGTTIDDKSTKNVTTFDDLFNSLVLKGHARRPGAEFNFHGDIPEGDVDCIAINDILPGGIESPGTEEIEKFVFANADIIRNSIGLSLDAEILQLGSSSASRQSAALFDGHFGESDFIGETCIAHNGSFIKENSTDRLPANTEFGGELLDTSAAGIKGVNFFAAGSSEINPSDRGDGIIEPLFESSTEVPSTAFIVDTKLSKCDIVIKGFLRVQKKFLSEFDGHVYTLESNNGWYNITPAEIIVKNCRCRMLAVVRFDED